MGRTGAEPLGWLTDRKPEPVELDASEPGGMRSGAVELWLSPFGY